MSGLKKLAFLSSSRSSIDKSSDVSYIVTSVDEDGTAGDEQPIVTSPGGSPPVPKKFEKNAAHSLVSNYRTEGYNATKAMASQSKVNRMHTKDIEVEEMNTAKQMKSNIESDAFSASKSSALRQDKKMLRIGESVHQEQSMAKTSAMKMQTEDQLAESTSYAQKHEATTMSQGMMKQEQATSQSSSSHFHSKAGSGQLSSSSTQISESSSSQVITSSGFGSDPMSLTHPLAAQAIPFSGFGINTFGMGHPRDSSMYMIEDVTDQATLDAECEVIEGKVRECIEKLKSASSDEITEVLKSMYELMRKASNMLGKDTDFSDKLNEDIRKSGCFDIIVKSCFDTKNNELQVQSGQTLQYCLSEANCMHLATSGIFDSVVEFANSFGESSFSNTQHSRIGTGIISQLCKVSEEMCKELVYRGALSTMLKCCRSIDTETQRNSAIALSNFALFGGPENHAAMIKHKIPEWLLFVGCSPDDHVCYNGCLAIVALASNKEIESYILKQSTLNHVAHFMAKHSARQFAANPLARSYGQSKAWLKKLVSVLDSDREEAKSLAAFHFAMIAHQRKGQKSVSIFSEIGAIDALRRVASSPNAFASKYVAQALKVIGEEVPQKLSQQVPLWSIEDVALWVKQVGFQNYAQEFFNSKVDGDLLLQLDDEMLREDIGIKNSILRKRFLRELAHLKRITDYSSCDGAALYQILNSMNVSQYTYTLLQCGIDSEMLAKLTEDQLRLECKIENSIHRRKIADTAKTISPTISAENAGSDKTLDVFVSYRRSNGSQLASLLKVLLEIRGFSTFIDVERLEAGKFDCNLINSIKQAKHFLLVLTPNSLDRCINDSECKDWVHKEIVEALKNNCNIIPVLENFDWPEPEKLPDDMRAVCRFNGIRWIHEYQDACIDKLDRFMKGIIASAELEPSQATATESSSKKDKSKSKNEKNQSKLKSLLESF